MLVKSLPSINKRQPKVLVGVSGGPDSMALLHMLQSQYQVIVLHVNYQVRGKEAQQETEQLRAYCLREGLELEYLYAPLVTEGNFQDQARKFRYWFAQEMAQKHGVKSLFLGHHNDDHLKTFLMWRQRFLLVYGLKPISQYGELFVHRPLLNYRKVDLQEYCHQHQLPYSIDSSNSDQKYVRNQLLIPESQRQQLNQIIIQKNIELASFRQTQLREFTDKSWFWQHTAEWQNAYLLRILERCGQHRVSVKHLVTIKQFLRGDKLKYRIGDYYLINQYGVFYLFQEYHYTYTFANIQALMESDNPFLVQSVVPTGKVLQLRDSDFPLIVRNFLPGDILWFSYGSKKVNRFFIDRKLPYWQRFACPLVVNSSGRIIYLGEIGMVNRVADSNFKLYMV